MKYLFLTTLLLVFQASCTTPEKGVADPLRVMRPYMEAISSHKLEATLSYLASDSFEGRATGTPGQVAAAYYLASELAKMGVSPTQTNKAGLLENYFHLFSLNENTQAQNVIGIIEGSDPQLKNEYVILSAHYDHLGRDEKLEGDQIYNGAADDGSGTVALLQIAESLMRAKIEGVGPRRSVLIALFAGEEKGLLGSIAYVQQSLPLLDSVAAEINLDGVGGFDLEHPSKSTDYIYVVQIDSTSSHLAEKVKTLNKETGINLNLDPPLHPERFVSDSRPFQYAMVPTIYFSTGLTEHYHKISDDPSTIDYAHLARVTQLIFALAWEVGNSDALNPPYDRTAYAFSGKYICHPCGCSKDVNTVFDAPGKCPACKMELYPQWIKR